MVEILKEVKMRKMMTAILAGLLVATLLPAIAFAQTTEIYINNGPLTVGKNSIVTVVVRETGTKRLVEGAEVSMDGCGVGMMKRSNSKGEAVFAVVPTETGKIKVVVKLDGYHPTDTTIPVGPDRTEPPLDIDPIPSPTNQRQVTIAGRTRPGCEVYVGNVRATVDATGAFKATVALNEGKNTIRVKSSTQYATTSREINVELDSQNPGMIIETKLSKERYVDVDKITITGRVEPGSRVQINGIDAIVVNDYFVCEVPVKLGSNTLEIVATDKVGNTSKLSYEVKVWHKKVIKVTIDSTQAFVDGKEEILSSPPKIINNRTMVPLRFIGTAFGALFNYDQPTKTITITFEGKTIILPINSKTATVDGISVAVDPPAQLVGGSTMVPLRFIADIFGATTAYDPQTRTVTVTREEMPQ
jgi:hypothetical protein